MVYHSQTWIDNTMWCFPVIAKSGSALLFNGKVQLGEILICQPTHCCPGNQAPPIVSSLKPMERALRNRRRVAAANQLIPRWALVANYTPVAPHSGALTLPCHVRHWPRLVESAEPPLVLNLIPMCIAGRLAATGVTGGTFSATGTYPWMQHLWFSGAEMISGCELQWSTGFVGDAQYSCCGGAKLTGTGPDFGMNRLLMNSKCCWPGERQSLVSVTMRYVYPTVIPTTEPYRNAHNLVLLL
jgi:hypothetical protein